MGHITVEGGLIKIVFAYDSKLVAAVKTLPGRRFDPTKKYWTVPLVYAGQVLAWAAKNGFSSAQVDPALDQAIHESQQVVIASRAETTDLVIPSNTGLVYRPFQCAGVEFALRHISTLLGDEMGLGKTIEVAGLLNADPGLRRVLVICPTTPKINWQRELTKWLVTPRSIGIVNGAKWVQADIIIINYDLLNTHAASLRALEWDLLVVDESHLIKNPRAQRSKNVMGYKRRNSLTWDVTPLRARRKMFLTGTPIPNRPIELWPALNYLLPETFNNFFAYALRYCGASQGRYGWDFSGSSHLDELQEVLRSTCMIRRLKKDVLPELPAKIRQIVPISAKGYEELLSHQDEVLRTKTEKLWDLKAQVELAKAGEDTEAYAHAVRALSSETMLAFAEIARERHALAVAKIPDAIAFLEDIVTEHKVIVMAHHHDVINALCDHFGNIAVKLTGEESKTERQQAIDDFQNRPEIMMFVGSIQAAGVSITLTAASHIVFVELDWVPGNVSQAEDRAHRIGQTDSVLVQHLVVDGSLDAHMAQVLIDKQAVLDAALDDITFKDEPVLPLLDEAATETLSRKKLDAEPALSEAQILAVHRALKTLAGMCDGATTLDGSGFNKLDARIGHNLAETLQLTQRQAKLGLRLAKKYHRQLPPEILEALG